MTTESHTTDDMKTALRQAAGSGEPFVLLDRARSVAGEPDDSRLYTDPVMILTTRRVDDIPDLLDQAGRILEEGYPLAGFIAYPAATGLEEALAGIAADDDEPLAWLGVFNRVRHFRTARRLDPSDPPASSSSNSPVFRSGLPILTNVRMRDTRRRYMRKIAAIKDYIAAGDTYQVNLTTDVTFDANADPVDIYFALRDRQPVPYGACIRTETRFLLSFSPELFFRIHDAPPPGGKKTIISRPMKGTLSRDPLAENDDDGTAESLRSDEKNRAENTMIVDLIRNDLGRICEPGSVRVSNPFDVEVHPTVYQMTSTVSGVLRERVTPLEILRATFPCGSVTGAPKIRTMRIIDELERRARGVYTGAIGYFDPDGGACFNVAIRTLVIDENHRGRMGVGGAVVWDSDPESEYEEARAKAAFIRTAGQDFQIIETVKYTTGTRRFDYLDDHLDRMRATALHFGFPFSVNDVRTRIEQWEADVFRRVTGDLKVRFLLNPAGRLDIESQPLEAIPTPVRLAVSAGEVDSDDIWLYHKTTQRRQYIDALARAASAGYRDLVFLNERGHVTECATANIFLKRDGIWLTPPVADGLLNGVFRRNIESITGCALREKSLTLNDLKSGGVYIGNSVRGLLPAVVDTDTVI